MQKDTQIKLIPVKTQDGFHIKEGIPLYKANVISGYRQDYEVREFIVIHVNNSHRRFKARDIEDGTEVTISMYQKIISYYKGKKINALKDIVKIIKSDLDIQKKEVRREIRKLNKIQLKLNSAIRKVTK